LKGHGFSRAALPLNLPEVMREHNDGEVFSGFNQAIIDFDWSYT
jgi:hypothetical protein